jgi:hypothetical protein
VAVEGLLSAAPGAQKSEARGLETCMQRAQELNCIRRKDFRPGLKEAFRDFRNAKCCSHG